MSVVGRAAALTGVATAVVSLIALTLDATLLFRVTKPVPAVALAVWTAANARSRSTRLIVAGLIASAIGDALLDVQGAFVGGMAAFGAAHIIYIVALTRGHGRALPALALPFVAWGVGLFLWVRSGLGALVVPVGAYAVILCSMMWRAAVRHSINRTDSAKIGLVGAVLFGLSDSLIALKLGGSLFPGMRAVILITYWIGQAGIAASFLPRS